MDDVTRELEQWRQAAKRISWHSIWKYPVSISILDGFDGQSGIKTVSAVMTIDSPDITGETNSVGEVRQMVGDVKRLPAGLSADQRVGFLVDLCRKLIIHELDERLLVDGAKANDPHPERTRTAPEMVS